jgi:hypothetical protein
MEKKLKTPSGASGSNLRTLKDFVFVAENNCKGHILVYPADLRQEAIKIIKRNKEITTADWIEFFNIEDEFAKMCFSDKKDLETNPSEGNNLKRGR